MDRDIEVIKIYTRFTLEEKETVLNYNCADKMWEMYSIVPKHFNKALKQGWTPKVRYEYDDGSIAGYVLTAPARAVTIRNVNPKQMSEKQLRNLSQDDDEEE
jgi:hypothetical protein